MAYNEALAQRVRELLADIPGVSEKNMFGGICFMVNDKMCIGMATEELMCRIGEAAYEHALEQPGCREMTFTGRSMKGYVYVHPDVLKTKKALSYWINLCLAFNPLAKAAKKKTK